MLQLAPQENVLLVMRRHWFVLVRPASVFAVLLALPLPFIALAPRLLPQFEALHIALVIKFASTLYLMALLTWALVIWLSYYLDVWIITDQRIIDVEQYGLFHREVSEIAADRIQNVTIETPGFIATVLKFGTIRIQTAGQGEFVITEVPHCERAKTIILQRSRSAAL